MAQPALLALDVGTSGCRAEIFDLGGGSGGRHHVEYAIATPEPGAAEQDPEQWWQAVLVCTAQARAALREPVRLVAVGLSVQGHTWVPVDETGQALRPALTWLDSRAAPYARRLLEERGPAFWGDRAGKLPGPWHLLSQWLWLREHEPEVARQTRRLLLCHDWLLARLTGEPATDLTHAATTLLLDLHTGAWHPPALADYGLSPEFLSPVKLAGTWAGKITLSAAQALGLEPDGVVAVGAQDQKCAALAAGLGPHTATVSLGTAVAIAAPVAAPCFDPERGAIPCFPWLRRGEWVLEAPLTTGGGALRWLRDLLTETEALAFESLLDAAANVPPGAEGVTCLPYLAGAGAPHWRSEATASFTGLTLRSGRGHLTRAVLEGVAADIADSLECMAQLDSRLDRLHLFGGGTRSALWPQIIAACSGLPTETCRDAEAATRGAAMLAAQALDADPSVFALETEPVTVPRHWPEAYAAVREHYRREREGAWGATGRG